jgi:hypothetical protein
MIKLESSAPSDRFWRRPDMVYAYAQIGLWIAFVFSAVTAYVTLRRAVWGTADLAQFGAAIAVDLTIGLALAVLLSQFAKRWAAQKIGLRQIVWRCLLLSAALFAAYQALGLCIIFAVSGWPGAIAWYQAIPGRSLSTLVDYTLFWAVAISVVPIPFLRAEFKPHDAGYSEAESVVPPLPTALANLGEILAITSAENYVELHSSGRTVLYRATMSQMEQLFPPPRYIRVHRRSIVRADQVVRLTRTSNGALLETAFGRSFSVSRTYLRSVTSAVTNDAGHQ